MKFYFEGYIGNILPPIQKELNKYWTRDSEYIEEIRLEFKT